MPTLTAQFVTQSATTESQHIQDGKLRADSNATAPDDLAQAIVQGRASVLSYLLKLNKCIDAQHADLVQAVMQRFSESLIDYISFGHFRLFATHQPQTHHLVALDNITRRVIAFNDRFSNLTQISLLQLKASLEELAIALEVQFEIEDEIVAFERY